MIPKIIHYCWLSDDPIPQNLQNCMNSWKEKIPDYEFILWNFDRFDKNSSKWVTQAFDNKKYAFAADYIRLYAVYNYGGFYMDMDIEVLKPFDDLLSKNIVLAYEDDEKIGIEAGVFGAEQYNSIIKNCLDYYTDKSFIKEDGTFDTKALPYIMNDKCKNIEINDRFFFTCKSKISGFITTKSYSYSIHHFAGSWLQPWFKEVADYNYTLYREKGYTKFNRIKAIVHHIKLSFINLGFMGAFKYWMTRIKERM